MKPAFALTFISGKALFSSSFVFLPSFKKERKKEKSHYGTLLSLNFIPYILQITFKTFVVIKCYLAICRLNWDVYWHQVRRIITGEQKSPGLTWKNLFLEITSLTLDLILYQLSE